jgi:hypothetical protein
VHGARNRAPAAAALVAASLCGLVLLPSCAQGQPAHRPATTPVPDRRTTSICTTWGTTTVGGGDYIVMNDEWGSSAPECVATDGNPDFQVTSSSIDMPGNPAPGGYPAIYMGCHWGTCSPNQGGLPRQVRDFSPGSSSNPLTSVTTTQPGGSSVYDVTYDIWFNHSPATSTQANAEELMVFLNENGGVRPFGTQVATATIDGVGYDIWEGRQTSWNLVAYWMQKPATSVRNLNIGDLALDSVRRGYMSASDWLIEVDMGFELWAGGQGLAVDTYSVAPDGVAAPTG